MKTDNSFTDQFVEYASDVTDAPESLLFWSGVLALSTVIGRRLFMRFGDGELVPNIWMILLGPSSAHKSTALKLARGIITRVKPDILFPEEWTRELLLKVLSEQPHTLMLHDEMRTFFSLLERDYNVGAMSCLTTLFEEPGYRRKIMSGEVIIKDAYICLAGASTPEWLVEGIKDKHSAIMSGFLPRFLLINSPKIQQKVQVWYKPVDQIKKEKLARRLGQISCMQGEMTYTPEAKVMYEDWFTSFHRRMEGRDHTAIPFLNKIKTIYSHKIAILATADMASGHIMEVTPEAWNMAENMLNGLERSISSLVGGLTETKWDKDRQRIEKYLTEHLECPREVLADALRIHGNHLTKHLQGLEADGKIQMVKKTTSKRPVSIILWDSNKVAGEE